MDVCFNLLWKDVLSGFSTDQVKKADNVLIINLILILAKFHVNKNTEVENHVLLLSFVNSGSKSHVLKSRPGGQTRPLGDYIRPTTSF